MDYQGRSHPLPILYTLPLCKGIRCYFPNDIIGTVEISIDEPSIGCTVEATLDTSPAKDGLAAVFCIINWQRVTVKETGFASVRLFCDLYLYPDQFCLVG